jgi:uncharacterized protein (UPF0333 family)
MNNQFSINKFEFHLLLLLFLAISVMFFPKEKNFKMQDSTLVERKQKKEIINRSHEKLQQKYDCNGCYINLNDFNRGKKLHREQTREEKIQELIENPVIIVVFGIVILAIGAVIFTAIRNR